MPQEHIVKAYDDQLADLDRTIAEMGGLVEKLLSDATNSVVNYDVELAKQTIASDKRIDACEQEIVEGATKLLALRQPMAADLRKVIATIRLSNDLERMGDYAKNISKRVITISQSPILSSISRSVERMSKMVEDMIREVLDAYIQGDVAKAHQVIYSDEDVDRLHTSLFREILTYMMEDPRNITACTHFLFIAKNIERIGDHATNIAEQIHFIVEGDTFDNHHESKDKSATIVAEL
ncbi:phosphate transport system regulatory protein PhoU [Kordiimonas sediminis]|uniref:Phosphate-specific transport system accessory protein PhoU n=1 Tax=Kordiimonas sediminis TaxID=1735581 RepID=A0A919E1Z6_9PROT|nr:phosphate signaling complex protein PhoU [Kordiimonas sediminis]GHF11502.1 phosphate transport system regulatory protein PhoU [Kordiimonas sediminis]